VDGTWFVRVLDPDKRPGKSFYKRKHLGDYALLDRHEVFGQARRDAEIFTLSVESGGTTARTLRTVADACIAYSEGKPAAVGILNRTVYSDPLAKVSLDKLRRHHLRSWRKRLEETPALITRNKGGETRTKPRAPSTVNRDMVPLRAALTQVLSPGAPNTEAAWQEALKPNKGADKRRTLFLDREERKKLLAACDRESEPFVRGMCLLPLRPGVLAGLRAADFDRRTRSLTIGTDKTGTPRQISLPPSAADFLVSQLDGKLPAAPIFTRDTGSPWNKDSWKHPIKSAVRKAKLPDEVAAYTLRHSVITDLVRSGIPVLTVAQLSGTSVAMIENHYGHLVRDDAEKALASLALD
jgi:integrase